MEVSLSDFWSDGQYPVEQPRHLPIRATSGVGNDRYGRKEMKTDSTNLNGGRHLTAEMLNTAFRNADEDTVDKVHEVRDECVNILYDQHNTMLNMAVTFLSIALPLYGSLKTSIGNKWCIGVAIVSDLICMIIVAQRKLPRQMRQVVNKKLWQYSKARTLKGKSHQARSGTRNFARTIGVFR